MEVYATTFIRKLGDYDRPRTRPVTLTRRNGKLIKGVTRCGLVWDFKPKELHKIDGTKLSKRELELILGEVV